MFNKCVSVHSAGKIFGVTGWKVGWAIGPTDLILAAKSVRVYTSFTSNTPGQQSLSVSLKQGKEI